MQSHNLITGLLIVIHHTILWHATQHCQWQLNSDSVACLLTSRPSPSCHNLGPAKNPRLCTIVWCMHLLTWTSFLISSFAICYLNKGGNAHTLRICRVNPGHKTSLNFYHLPSQLTRSVRSRINGTPSCTRAAWIASIDYRPTEYAQSLMLSKNYGKKGRICGLVTVDLCLTSPL